MKRSTWIFLLLFLAAIGAFLYLKYRPAPANKAEDATPTATTAPTKYLFTESSAALISIRIHDRKNNVVLLERPSGGLWIVSLPIPAPAEQSQAEAGASQLAALEIQDTLNPSVAAGDVGLNAPQYTMELNFETIGKHKLEIGDQTPTGDGYYVRYDGGPIYILSAYSIDAVLNLLTTPPYLPTETPVPAAQSSTPIP